MKHLFLCRILPGLLLMLVYSAAGAQFISKGYIEYERKTNQYAFMDENDTWDQLMKKSFSKFITAYYDLYFTSSKTLFKPGRDPEEKQNKYWGALPADNIVFANLDSNRMVTQKTMYSNTYLISDSLRHIDWRIGTEMRTIAGFNCRKAVGKILDSIVVVAFYSEEIIPSGGPESFTGLPGMILGLAIPRAHTTWYATKIQVNDPSPANLAVPRKGKKMEGPEFYQQLSEIMKNWDESFREKQWQVLY